MIEIQKSSWDVYKASKLEQFRRLEYDCESFAKEIVDMLEDFHSVKPEKIKKLFPELDKIVLARIKEQYPDEEVDFAIGVMFSYASSKSQEAAKTIYDTTRKSSRPKTWDDGLGSKQP